MNRYIACATFELNEDGSRTCVGIFEASKNDHLNFRMIYSAARAFKNKPTDEVHIFVAEPR